MEMNARCIACLIKKQDEKIRKESDEKKKLSYMPPSKSITMI